MDTAKVPIPVRQRKLAYDEDDTWERLPIAVRKASLALLTQILKSAARNALTEENNHERQDSA